MVLDFLTYDAKVAVMIAVFYLFYRLVLAKETFHRVNRVVLLMTAVVSFVLPLCVITMHQTVVIDAAPTVDVGDVQAVVADEPAATPFWQLALPTLFIIGVVVTLCHTLISVARVWQLIRHSEQHRQADGTVICVTDRQVSPFSWFHYIVLSRQDYVQQDAAVLAHERGHIRLRHSWDVLLVDILTALQWFNPAMWLLRQDLRAIHEYEADGAVLSQGFNARQYQYLLITKAASIGGYSIANGISHSTLKNRITMMLHKENKRSHLVKLLALVPIVGAALALNAETVTDYRYDNPQKKQVIKKGKKNAVIKTGAVNDIVVVGQGQDVTPQSQTAEKKEKTKDDEKVTPKPVEMPDAMQTEPAKKPYDVVEQMPVFPGGAAALMKYLSGNVRYPEAAEKAGVQGRVIVTFIVEKDGSITEAYIVKSVDPLLDAEAIRVINAMPNWLPGRQNGDPVRVKYTVPITFRLGGIKDPNVTVVKVGNDHKGKSFELLIDDKVHEPEALNSLNPADIESMRVEKAKDGQPKDRIIVKMKQKK